MEEIRRLCQDHAFIRRKLVLLESALEVLPEARMELRELCHSLQRVLHEHMQREAPVIRVCYSRLVPIRSVVRIQDHSADHALLRGVSGWLQGGLRASIPLVVLRLSQLIEQMRERMEQQEHKLFSLLAAPPEHAEPAARSSAISPSMSVNEIVQRYPSTQPVFERLRINRLCEGYESVDELAWRHGIEPSEILEQIRQVARDMAES